MAQPAKSEAPHAPGYWKYETSGIVKAVVRRYLFGAALLPDEIAVLREYCRQWIMAPVWDANPNGDGKWLALLRDAVEGITSIETLEGWLEHAANAGCNPL